MADGADEEEKTEEPTSKKIEDSKSEGNVPKSAEIPGAVILALSSVYLIFFADPIYLEIEKMIRYIFSFIGSELNSRVYYTIVNTVIYTVLYSLMPLFIMIIFLAVVSNVAQFGFIITAMKFNLGTLNPISGMKNVFSAKKALEALKLIAKLTVIFITMVVLLGIVWDDIIAMMDQNLQNALNSMFILLLYFVFTILFIIILFAIIDFYFTRYYYFKQLRMTKQEVKDEHKNIEGNPEVKARIKSIQMKMARQRMMADVPNADVVITNPDHYAVALQYDDKKSSAPKIVAKGIDFLALKIKDIAKQSNIPIIEDPALARALYEQLEVEQEIPEAFYKAIAEIFTYIYSLNGKGKN